MQWIRIALRPVERRIAIEFVEEGHPVLGAAHRVVEYRFEEPAHLQQRLHGRFWLVAEAKRRSNVITGRVVVNVWNMEFLYQPPNRAYRRTKRRGGSRRGHRLSESDCLRVPNRLLKEVHYAYAVSFPHTQPEVGLIDIGVDARRRWRVAIFLEACALHPALIPLGRGIFVPAAGDRMLEVVGRVLAVYVDYPRLVEEALECVLEQADATVP